MKKHLIKKYREAANKFIDDQPGKPVTYLRVDNLGRSDFLNLLQPGFTPDAWVNGCRWIVSSILMAPMDKRKVKKGGWVPLYSNILIKFLGNRYKVFLDTLMAAGIIEADGKYSKTKRKSLGYRLTSEFRDRRFAFRTFPNDALITKAVKRYRRDKAQKLKEKAYHLPHLTRWLIAPNLNLDQTEGAAYLTELSRVLDRELMKLKLSSSQLIKATTEINQKMRSYRFQLEGFPHRTGFSIDDKGGRIYSRLTHLPSVLRGFLTHDGQPLVSVDISNSQPFHLQLLLQPEFWTNGRGLEGLNLLKLDEDLYNHVQRTLQSDKRTSPTIMSYFSAGKPVNTGLWGYPSLASNGKLYEFMSNRMAGKFMKGTRDRFGSRKDAKNELIRMFFFNPKEPYSPSGKVFQEFKKLLPEVGSIIETLKQRDYREFPILLQKIEAQMVLHRVTKDVFAQAPDAPLYTIHDSILTTEPFLPLLRETIQTQYIKVLGSAPRVEIVRLTPVYSDLKMIPFVLSKLAEISKGKILSSGLTNAQREDFDQDYIRSHTPAFSLSLTEIASPSFLTALPEEARASLVSDLYQH